MIDNLQIITAEIATLPMVVNRIARILYGALKRIPPPGHRVRIYQPDGHTCFGYSMDRFERYARHLVLGGSEFPGLAAGRSIGSIMGAFPS